MFRESSRIALRRLTILFFILLLTQSWEGRLLAQANTSLIKTLPLNETISGQLRGKGEKVTYSLDVPIDQDVVVEYRSNKLVFSYHCVFTDVPAPDDEHCSDYGGSGGDRPVNSYDLVTTLGQKEQRTTVTLIRVLDGPSTYQITAYPITPQAIRMGESVTGTSADLQPYQIYSMEADPTVPFTVEVEDEAADGNFLWAAYQPFAFESFPEVEKQLLMPTYIDGASSDNGAVGINRLHVYYLGGRTFHVLVRSPKNYILNTTTVNWPVLDENHTTNLTVSYRKPILVTQLNIQPGERAQVNFDVTVGKGAIVRVFEVGSPIDEGLSLGQTGTDGPTFELSGSLQRTAIKTLYVVVQIPFAYTRDKVNINVKWQRVT